MHSLQETGCVQTKIQHLLSSEELNGKQNKVNSRRGEGYENQDMMKASQRDIIYGYLYHCIVY